MVIKYGTIIYTSCMGVIWRVSFINDQISCILKLDLITYVFTIDQQVSINVKVKFNWR